MDHPIPVTFIRLIVLLPLIGATINFLAGAWLQKTFGKRAISLVGCGVVLAAFLLAARAFYAMLQIAAGKSLHARRLVEVVRRRRTESRHRVLARSVVDDHDADNHRRRRAHSHLLDRLHARRRRLLAIFRMAQPVHLRDAGAGAGRQHVADVRRLGRRGAVLVRADRLLVQGPGEHDRRQQGLHREPRRRPRVRDRAVQSVRWPAGARASDAGDARGRALRAAARGSADKFRRLSIRRISWSASSRC